MILWVGENDGEVLMEEVTGLVLLYRESEIFPGNMLGCKVASEVAKLMRVEDTVVAKEVCDGTEEFTVPETGRISEVDVKLTVDTGTDQYTSVNTRTMA